MGMQMGDERQFSVESALRRRGLVLARTGDRARLPYPADPAAGHDLPYRYMGKPTFRKMVRRLLASRGEPVGLEKLKSIAGEDASFSKDTGQSAGWRMGAWFSAGMRLTTSAPGWSGTWRRCAAGRCGLTCSGASGRRLRRVCLA